jgi:hypothetical protein
MNAIPNRRGLLLGALTASAASTWRPFRRWAAAEPPDPVFAAIEALTAATTHIDDLRGTGDHVAYEEACNAEGTEFDALTKTREGGFRLALFCLRTV